MKNCKKSAHVGRLLAIRYIRCHPEMYEGELSSAQTETIYISGLIGKSKQH